MHPDPLQNAAEGCAYTCAGKVLALGAGVGAVWFLAWATRPVATWWLPPLLVLLGCAVFFVVDWRWFR